MSAIKVKTDTRATSPLSTEVTGIANREGGEQMAARSPTDAAGMNWRIFSRISATCRIKQHNIFGPKQTARHFADDIFKCIFFLTENLMHLGQKSPKIV